MIKYILDTSAILALLFLETGWEHVDRMLSESGVSAVNVAEALTKLKQHNISLESASKELFSLDLEIYDFTTQHALKAAELRQPTKHLGLSLGDRSCLALAIHENATAVTADRLWSKLNVCPIELIR